MRNVDFNYLRDSYNLFGTKITIQHCHVVNFSLATKWIIQTYVQLQLNLIIFQLRLNKCY